MKNAHTLIALFFFLLTLNIHSQIGNKEKQAVFLYEHKKIDDAAILFQQVLQEEPENANAQEYLANIAFDKMQYKMAAQKIKSLVEKYPNEARYHFKYAGCLGLYAQNNKLKAAFLIDDIKKHFHTAVDLDNTFVDAYLGLVHLYMELPRIFGGSKEKAMYYAQRVKMLSKKAGEDAMKIIVNAS